MLDFEGNMIFEPEDSAAGISAVEMGRAATGGRELNEGWDMRADGGRFWDSGLMMPLHDPDGTSIGHLRNHAGSNPPIGLAGDLEDSEARLQGDLQSDSDGAPGRRGAIRVAGERQRAGGPVVGPALAALRSTLGV